jgi:hypothetical protein
LLWKEEKEAQRKADQWKENGEERRMRMGEEEPQAVEARRREEANSEGGGE